jgi:hypothetical protein
VCPGAFLPEVWVTTYPPQQQRIAASSGGDSGGSATGVSTDDAGGATGSQLAAEVVTAADLRQHSSSGASGADGSSGDGGSGSRTEPVAGGVSGALSAQGFDTVSRGGASGDTCSSEGSRERRAAGAEGSAASSEAAAAAPLARHCVTGFACGPMAAAISALPAAEAVRRALAQLDQMFGA